MEVFESFVLVVSEEVVVIKLKGEGIERFRRKVEFVNVFFFFLNLLLFKENNLIFS